MIEPSQQEPPKISEIRTFVDERGRVVHAMIPVGLGEIKDFTGEALIQQAGPNGQKAHMPFRFKIEGATNIIEAFGLFEEQAKAAGEKIATQMNRPHIIHPGQMPGNRMIGPATR